MDTPYPTWTCYVFCSSLIVLLQLSGTIVHAQAPAKDSTTARGRVKPALPVDSLSAIKDTALKFGKQLFQSKSSELKTTINNKRQLIRSLRPDSSFRFPADSLTFDIKSPFRNLLKTRPVARFDGGFVSYGFNYRSNIDTPYAEKDIAQHNISGSLQATAAGVIPLQVNYWIRQSNSRIFNNIVNVQLVFNGAEFRNRLQTAMRNRMLALAPSLKDSLTEKWLALKKLELGKTDQLLQSFSMQSLIEANEILRVPKVTYNPQLPDSINRQREDSLKKMAAFLIDTYTKTKMVYDSLHKQVDSLDKAWQQNKQKIARYRQLINGGWKDAVSLRDYKNKLGEYGLDDVEIPAKYRWLLGLRQFSVGRSVANYSELTAKNISVNGLNFEYNSWYYVGVSAGTVNYRFREFVVNGGNKKPQYMYLLRAGLGRLEKNYFILSYFRGRKQLFAAGASRSEPTTISGITAEARWQVNANTWLNAEVAKSYAPDFRDNPPPSAGKFGLRDKTSQAMAVKLVTFLPVTNTRVEGFYKYTGANFQSFTTFRTNAALESWYVKAEQGLFKRALRVYASIRKNEFSNPYIVQQYKSNTVFKSLSATFRMRKWPVISAGYQPMSQLTVLDNQVIENRFHTLFTTVYHAWKLQDVRTASTLMLNKFYNTGADTGFIYYNATSIYLAQNFFFHGVTANIGGSHTRNPGYTLNVLDGSIQPAIPKLGTVGIGIKVNNLNTTVTKLGAYINANVRIWKQDLIYISYEKGYLPGFNKGLVRNEMASIQYTKYFKSR